MSGDNSQGNFGPMKKGGEVFPCEIFFGGGCTLEVSRGPYGCHSAQGCHTHFRFQVAFLTGVWQQFCDRDVAMCCKFGVSFLCMFCVFLLQSFLGIWHFELWGWRHFPPAKSFPGEIPPPICRPSLPAPRPQSLPFLGGGGGQRPQKKLRTVSTSNFRPL